MNKVMGVDRETVIADKDYKKWLGSLKLRFKNSQIQAAVRVNSSMLEFYWSLAQDLVKMKAEEKWGAGVIEQISIDMKAEFPTAKGFSTRNLWKVKQWFLFYAEKLPQVVAEIGKKKKLPQVGAEIKMPEKFAMIPWGHHTEIISKCKSVDEAFFYIDKTIENGCRPSLEKCG